MKFTFINLYDDSITFEASGTFGLTKINGISGVTGLVTESYTPVQIGTTITGVKVDSKEIELLGDFIDGEENRAVLINTFLCDKGKLIYEGLDKRLYLDVYVINSPDIEKINPLYDSFSVNLKVPYPYWKNMDKYVNAFVTEKSEFSYPKSFSNRTPFKISSLSSERIKTVVNRSAVPVGFVAEFEARGVVSDPGFTNIDTQEKISFTGLELQNGDVVRISTVDDQKYVRLIRGSQSINVFKFLEDESSFFKLHRGNNRIQFDAKQGINSLFFTISYERIYTGI